MKITDVKYRYKNRNEPILESISSVMDSSDKIGLTGSNGSGKSTLLKLITKKLKPDSGNIIINNDLIMGYLEQEAKENIPGETVLEHLYSDSEQLKNYWSLYLDYMSGKNQDYENVTRFEEAGGFELEYRIDRLWHKMGLSMEIGKQEFTSLSSGQKTRISLMKLLLKEADILILDEPTNHLDQNTVSWLCNFIHEFQGGVIAVSHDRYFLDKCCNRIWKISQGKLESFTGNYSEFKDYKEKEYERIKLERELKKKKIRKLQIAFDKRKGEAIQRENFKPPRSIKKNGGMCKRDMYGVTQRKEQAMMKSAMAVSSRMERMIEKEMKDLPVVEKRYRIHFPENSLKGKHVFSLYDLSMKFDDNWLFKNLSFSVPANSRIGITGKNGCGKSTLLKIIMGKCIPTYGSFNWSPQAEISYYAQEHDNLDESLRIIDEVRGVHFSREGEARNILGQLGITGDMVFNPINSLSTGEKGKTSLAKCLFQNTNTLILDEPMNHLEINSREAIEEGLMGYNGTIIFVSHDSYFVNRIADHIFDMDTMKFTRI